VVAWSRGKRRAREATAELYTADRETRRVQVYHLEGRHLRKFGAAFLNL